MDGRHRFPPSALWKSLAVGARALRPAYRAVQKRASNLFASGRLTIEMEQGRYMVPTPTNDEPRNISRTNRPGRRGWRACGIAAVSLLLLAAAPARADFCIQLDGGVFSGDLGFFRFKGTRPTTAGSVMTLKGRIAGLSPVFGTAVVAKDGTYLEIGATFFADAEQGQIDLAFFPPTGTSGSGDGDYGQYGTGQSFTAKIVRCRKEP